MLETRSHLAVASALLVLRSVLPLLRNSAIVLLQAIPMDMYEDMDQAKAQVLQLLGVVLLKEWHVWYHGQEKTVATVCVRVQPTVEQQQITQQITAILQESGVHDITVQVEKDDAISFEAVCGRPGQVLQL